MNEKVPTEGLETPHMTNETNTTTPADDALLRSQHCLPTNEIRELTAIVPDFAGRYVNDYFADRAANRTRKNCLTIGIIFLCFAAGTGLIISAVLGQPTGQAITTVITLLSAICGAFYSSRIAK
jgi:hypothetical protein